MAVAMSRGKQVWTEKDLGCLTTNSRRPRRIRFYVLIQNIKAVQMLRLVSVL
jgi:hypothetical protein